MNRLLAIGFEPAGHWLLNGSEIVFELSRHGFQRNILYAFVSDGDVKYVGKTVQPLRNRMRGYQNPGSSQTTNIRNNARIKMLLESGAAVDILALPDNGLLHYGQFHLNLAAGLEDNIISVLRPEWNSPYSLEKELQTHEPQAPQQPIESFTIVLQKTYFNSGFFNIGIAHERFFGSDGQEIEIYCGGAEQPLIGTINRTANSNHTPRIMGGAGLRDWFLKSMCSMQSAKIIVLSPTAIRIEAQEG